MKKFDMKSYTDRLFCSLFGRVVRDRDFFKDRDVEVKCDVLQKRSVQKATTTTEYSFINYLHFGDVMQVFNGSSLVGEASHKLKTQDTCKLYTRYEPKLG